MSWAIPVSGCLATPWACLALVSSPRRRCGSPVEGAGLGPLRGVHMSEEAPRVERICDKSEEASVSELLCDMSEEAPVLVLLCEMSEKAPVLELLCDQSAEPPVLDRRANLGGEARPVATCTSADAARHSSSRWCRCSSSCNRCAYETVVYMRYRYCLSCLIPLRSICATYLQICRQLLVGLVHVLQRCGQIPHLHTLGFASPYINQG